MRIQKRVVLAVAYIGVATLTNALPVFARDLAKVNHVAITDKDLTFALSGLNEGQRQSLLKDANTRKELVLTLVDQEVLAQEAEKLKLDQEATFKDMMNVFRKQALMNIYVERKLSSQLTTTAAKKYYEANKDLFSTDQVRVQHILFQNEDEARKVLPLAKDSKNDFQALAEKYSKDPSVKNNRGEIGYIPRGRMAKDFSDAAFAASEGSVVGPIKTTFGYHLIKVIDKRLGKALEFDEIELQAKAALRAQLVRNLVDTLKKNEKIQINHKEIESQQ